MKSNQVKYIHLKKFQCLNISHINKLHKTNIQHKLPNHKLMYASFLKHMPNMEQKKEKVLMDMDSKVVIAVGGGEYKRTKW